MSETAKILEELAARIRQRQLDNPTTSYTAKLLQGDEDQLLKKIIEEAAETVLAAKSGNRHQLVGELADLCYHCLVAMARYNISADEVAAELQARGKQSGLAEKAARVQSQSTKQEK